MMPIPVSYAANTPAQPARPATVLPSAPAPVPLAAPAMVARVEWAGAVRPPDALLRAFRPEHEPRADPDLPTGPPPAFSANLLDQIPDTLKQALETVLEPPQDPEGGGDAAPTGGEAPLPDPAAGAPDATLTAPAGLGALPTGGPDTALSPTGAEASPTLQAGGGADLAETGQGATSPASAVSAPTVPDAPRAGTADVQLVRTYALMTGEDASRMDRSV